MYELSAKINRQTTTNLTHAECETLEYLCSGHGTKQVADKRHVSINTVKTQMESIYQKLGVHNIGALVAVAVALDVVEITIKSANRINVICLFLIYMILTNNSGIDANRVRVRLRIPRPTAARTTRLSGRIYNRYS